MKLVALLHKPLLHAATILTVLWLSQSTEAATPEVTHLRSLAQAILDRGEDSDAMVRATEYLDLTQIRIWTYNSVYGERSHQDVFHSVETRNGEQWVKFRSNYLVPLRRLSDQDQDSIQDLLRLQSQIARDHEATLRSIRAGETAAKAIAEQQRRAQEEEIKRLSIRRVRVLSQTFAQIQLGEKIIEKAVFPGEEFDLLASTKSFYKIEVAGRPATIPKQAAREIAARPGDVGMQEISANKPILGSILAPGYLGSSSPKSDRLNEPIELDIRYEFFSDANQYYLEVQEVFDDGLGQRIKLRPGDKIELLDGERIRSFDHFRSRLLDGPPLKLHVRNPTTGKLRIVRIELPDNNKQVEFGAIGSTNKAGEFVVSFVSPGDSIASRLGLRRQDRILALNNLPIRRPQDLERALKGATIVEAVILLRGALDPEIRSARLD